MGYNQNSLFIRVLVPSIKVVYTNILTIVDQLLIGTGLGLNFNEQGMLKDMFSYGIPRLNALVQIYLIPITTRAKSNIMYKICF